jgi:hypothetical protein
MGYTASNGRMFVNDDDFRRWIEAHSNYYKQPGVRELMKILVSGTRLKTRRYGIKSRSIITQLQCSALYIYLSTFQTTNYEGTVHKLQDAK